MGIWEILLIGMMGGYLYYVVKLGFLYNSSQPLYILIYILFCWLCTPLIPHIYLYFRYIKTTPDSNT